ncbi:MAG: hypothetical protein NTX25_15950 [Proteobacteria bacterium]|nr:hypothetical protein [Pseudomonadota bacterium]
MKFSSRREEILAKLAAKESAARDEASDLAQKDIERVMKTPVLHSDHKIPTTRRELLGAGLMGSLAYAVVPSIFTLAAREAYGAPVCSKGGGGSAMPGYLHVELSGGPAISGNFMFGKQASGAAFEPLAATGYSTLGLGATQLPGTVALDTSIKGQFHPGSQFLAGMKSVMSPAAIAKTVAVGMAGTSADDNANNPLNPIQLVALTAGNPGALIQIAGNSTQANTLGRTAPLNVAQNPGLAKATVANEASLANLVNPGLIATRFGNNTQASVAVADLAHKLSASKLAQFQAKDINQQVKDLVECGYMGAKDLLTQFTADKLTPSTDTTLNATPFNAINFATINTTGSTTQTALIMGKLLADGLSTGASIAMAGYDYHGQGRAAQDTKDFAAGQTVGIALEVAHRKSAPMFVAVTADGSTSSNGSGGANNRCDFSADNGSHCNSWNSSGPIALYRL